MPFLQSLRLSALITNTGLKMKLSELKTIDIFAKEWRDKVNGNSYFSSRVVLNLEHENELIIEIPFQYGYEEAYLFESMDAVKHLFPSFRMVQRVASKMAS